MQSIEERLDRAEADIKELKTCEREWRTKEGIEHPSDRELQARRTNDLMEQLLNEQQKLHSVVYETKKQVGDVHNTVNHLKSDVEVLKSNITELKMGQKKLESDVAEIKQLLLTHLQK